jgi:endonuclease/exonuclease/phosphatase family metal-dependent hydrolase
MTAGRGRKLRTLALVRMFVVLALVLALASGVQAARVCDGPGINHEPQAYAMDEVLSVLAFNVYLLPTDIRHVPFMGADFAKAQEERAERIARFLTPYDVVILSEAYDDDARETLLRGLRATGFVYNTHILGSAYRAAAARAKNQVYPQRRPQHACAGPEEHAACDDPNETNGFQKAGEGDVGLGQDGGVVILSKHPIYDAKELVFESCDGRDCNAAKGFVYARIQKGHARYHVIGTHAQFGWRREQREARNKQFRAISEFVANGSGIPRTEPVIIGGDFNTLRLEFDDLLDGDSLGVLEPTFLGHGYTRETRNDWVDAGNGYVDYVVAKKRWKAPSYSSNCPMIFRTLYDFEDTVLFTSVRGKDYCDLSDHYAVWGYFDFREKRVERPACPAPEFPDTAS